MGKSIVIIGGGVAGLAAGIYGEMWGLDCTVIEKNEKAGGALCAWKRNGYTIDGCIHWLTGTKYGTPLYRMWCDMGILGTQKPKETDAFFKSYYGADKLSFYADSEKTRAEMHRISPEDSREIDRFFKAVDAAAAMSGLNGKNRAKALATLAPYSRLDLYSLGKRFRHPLLRCAMSDYISGEYSSLGLLLAYAAYSNGNGYLPSGGSGAAAENAAHRFRALDGRLILGKTAEKIVTYKNRAVGVTLSDGEYIPCDGVICATDPGVTFGRLTDFSPPKRLSMYNKSEKYPVFSAVHIAFGVDTDSLPFTGTAIFPCRSFRYGSRILLREFSHEKSFSPEGKSLIQCMFISREDECRRWIESRENGEGYGEMKEKLAEEVRSVIEEIFPSLHGKLTTLDVWTPATYKRYLDTNCGSFMCYAVMPKTVPAHLSRRIGNLKNAVIASQWQKAPGGLPIAADEGRRAAKFFADRV